MDGKLLWNHVAGRYLGLLPSVGPTPAVNNYTKFWMSWMSWMSYLQYNPNELAEIQQEIELVRFQNNVL